MGALPPHTPEREEAPAPQPPGGRLAWNLLGPESMVSVAWQVEAALPPTKVTQVRQKMVLLFHSFFFFWFLFRAAYGSAQAGESNWSYRCQPQP